MQTYQIRTFLKTEEMSRALGISQRTLRELRLQTNSPFTLGRHYRFRGTTPKAPLQWFPEETDNAFTEFQAERWKLIETMDGGNASTSYRSSGQ